MSKSFEKYQKRRLRSSYISVVISISLVLFLLGVLGLLVLNTKKVSNYFKESAAITLFLKNDVNRDQILNLQVSIDEQSFTKSTKFISKEEAAEIYKKANGEDFMDFLGYNPLENSIDIYVKGDFVSPEKMEEIEQIYKTNQYVSSVSYDKPLIDLLTKNVRRISLFILVFCGLATLVVVVLINSSIRLSVYSKRFTIKTMQMVGATKRFIRKPFIWNSVKLGIIGAVLAIIELALLLYYMNATFPEFGMIDNRIELASLFGIIFGMGILITWISTFLATQRFLNLRTDELYY
ncbi:cell division protein FtsX [Lutimonas sp.]|jgi:cell division transport system permease protein|uniref:cell division protein FtsX n=1 Tax=Lutimonas sp. TaxID=1872403 RepID=UPI003C796D62